MIIIDTGALFRGHRILLELNGPHDERPDYIEHLRRVHMEFVFNATRADAMGGPSLEDEAREQRAWLSHHDAMTAMEGLREPLRKRFQMTMPDANIRFDLDVESTDPGLYIFATKKDDPQYPMAAAAILLHEIKACGHDGEVLAVAFTTADKLERLWAKGAPKDV